MSDKLKKCFDWHRRQYYLDFSDHIELIFSGTAEYIDDLEAENAKLRELCTDIFDRLRDEDEHCGECRSCEYDAWNFGDPKCIYAKRMRELGVEMNE